jgi:hypothetical protein
MKIKTITKHKAYHYNVGAMVGDSKITEILPSRTSPPLSFIIYFDNKIQSRIECFSPDEVYYFEENENE